MAGFGHDGDEAAGGRHWHANLDGAWKPPAGFTFQGHWHTADGMGGMFIAEADSAADSLEATAAFADLLEFHVVPVLDIMEAVVFVAGVALSPPFAAAVGGTCIS